MRTLFPFCFVLLMTGTLIAQSDAYQNTITVNAGFSLAGTLVNLLDNENLDEFDNVDQDEFSNLSGQFSGTSTPAIQVNYDRALANWFSLGAGVSYQKLGFDINNFSYTDGDNQQQNIDFVSTNFNRVNVSLRALFHYGNKNRMDLYSGLRLGITSWGASIESTDDQIEDDLEASGFVGINPAIQLIPFALRGYVTENIGINFETAIGAPHFFSIGLNYRL